MKPEPRKEQVQGEGRGPMSTPGKLAKYRDAVELRSDDHRVLTSHVQGGDGQWREVMTAHYRRAK